MSLMTRDIIPERAHSTRLEEESIFLTFSLRKRNECTAN